jgi:hypothetical protein
MISQKGGKVKALAAASRPRPGTMPGTGQREFFFAFIEPAKQIINMNLYKFVYSNL